MAKAIQVITKAANVKNFANIPRRLYSENKPPLKRVFDIPEQWYIEKGELSFKDDYTNQLLSATIGDVIVLPVNSAFSQMKFSKDTYVKQYIDDATERDRITTNVKINYLVIKTVLETIGQYEDFISVPYDNMGILFESAEEGTLYKYTDDWNIVDTVIQNFVERTGIHENVWYGKRRIKTGLRYDVPQWNGSSSIDFLDLSTGTAQQQKQDYDAIKDDPLDLYQAGITVEQDSLYTLENLLIFTARAIKKEEMYLLKNVFPSDIKLRQPRNSGTYLNADGMPPNAKYGRDLEKIIKHLFWTTSVGFENRLKLK